MKLCIGVTNITGRLSSLTRLILELERQAVGKDVLILWVGDNRKISLGQKRKNIYLMAKQAGCEYLSMIDDDDNIAPDYVDTLLTAIQYEPELINFKMMYKNGRVQKEVNFSSKYENQNLDFVYLRKSHALMCWRVDMLSESMYPDVTFSEDSIFADAACKNVENEIIIDKVLYFYEYNRETSTQPIC